MFGLSTSNMMPPAEANTHQDRDSRACRTSIQPETCEIASDLRGLAFPINRLTPLPDNPRQGDVGAVARSYATFGQRKPIVARHEGDRGIVIAGNHQLAAAQQLGWTHIAVVWVDDDDITAKAFALADNRTADIGSYDDAALVAMLEAVHAADEGLFEATSYDEAALAELVGTLHALDHAGSDTEPGERSPVVVTDPGDLILLGEHRLLCGDSTVASDVERLMDGHLADCLWTDPPYGVDYVGKTSDGLTIQNDRQVDVDALVRRAFALAAAALRPGAAVYCTHPAGVQGLAFTRLFDEAFSLRQGLVWNKGQMVLGHSDYHYSHEPILYGYTRCKGRRGRGGEGWYGDNSQTSVIDVRKPAANTEHPTSKPVALIERCLRNSSPTGGSVLDLFAGSGSTLIASGNLGRCCYALELEPAYCDVIVDRWERHTGLTAERVVFN
jgi:site-specific DNA-methyltransferase (adenine-specific)